MAGGCEEVLVPISRFPVKVHCYPPIQDRQGSVQERQRVGLVTGAGWAAAGHLTSQDNVEQGELD